MVLSATFDLDDDTGGGDTIFSYTVRFIDGSTQGPTNLTVDGTDPLTLTGTGGNAGKPIAYIEFTAASGDKGDIDLVSVVTHGAPGTLPDADLNTVIFVSDGAPNRSLDDSGAVITTTAQNSIDHILGVDDSSNEVGGIETDSDLTGTDQAFIIQAVGINVDGPTLTFLSQVEGPGNNGATNVTTPAQMTAVIAPLASGTTVPTAAASDIINGAAGSDIIFGDVPFTDTLANNTGLGSNPDGSGWAIFQTLEGRSNLESIDPANNGDDWTRADTIAYIQQNQAQIAQESARTGGHDTITGGLGDDVIYAQEGHDTINYTVGDGHDIVHGGSDGTNGDTLNVTGSSGNDTVYLETVAAYNTRTSSTYSGPGEALISDGTGILIEMDEIEHVTFAGGGGTDTFIVSGDFSTTDILNSTIPRSLRRNGSNHRHVQSHRKWFAEHWSGKPAGARPGSGHRARNDWQYEL